MKGKSMIVLVFAVTALSGTSLTVQASVSSRTALSRSRVSVKRGITAKLTVKNKPSGAKLRWSSKNTKVAKVKNGVITGLRKGKTVIVCRITYKRGRKKITKRLTAAVTVRNNKQVYPDGEGGRSGSDNQGEGTADCSGVPGPYTRRKANAQHFLKAFRCPAAEPSVRGRYILY